MDSIHYYILPSDPSSLSLDPLGLCNIDEPSTWDVVAAAIDSFRIKSSLSRGIHALPDLIQDISYSLHMNGHLETESLHRFICRQYPDPNSYLASQVLNNILDAALELPSLFPTHRIAYLNRHNALLDLSTRHIRSLISHQILTTLSPPKGNDWGCTFSSWYAGQLPMPEVVYGYLTAVFDYFTYPIHLDDHLVYRYYEILPPTNSFSFWTTGQLSPLFECLIIEPTSSQLVAFPHESIPCTLIASNSSPGFGTSCTQEELVTGACPPLLPMGALFVSPPVLPHAAIVVQGNVPLFHWRGQGREARFLGRHTKINHTFLFLDASEIDTVTSSPIPDIDPKYFFRDLHKAFTGLSALSQLGVRDVVSPLWGAGAFGGDPVIKSIILAAAASQTKVSLHLNVDVARMYQPFVTDADNRPTVLIDFLRCLQQTWRNLTVGEVVSTLQNGDWKALYDEIKESNRL